MYTPNDLKNIAFGKSTMGGYKVSDVDSFVDLITREYEIVYNDNFNLTKKIELLAAKIEEYRADEDNIRVALLQSQKLGDTVLRESKHKAEVILQDANIKAEKITTDAALKADRMVMDTDKELQIKNQEYEALKQEVSDFKSGLLAMYREHLTVIDALPSVSRESEEDSAAAPPEPMDGQETFAAPAEPVPAPVSEPVPMPAPEPLYAPPEPRMPFNLSDADDIKLATDAAPGLKFGEQYDIKQDEDGEDSEKPAGLFKRRR